MCHPAAIVRSTHVPFRRSEKIEGVTAWFQPSWGSPSSLYPFASTPAPGCGRSAAWAVFAGDSSGAPELASAQHPTETGCARVFGSTGWAFHRLFTVPVESLQGFSCYSAACRTSQLVRLSGGVSLEETSPTLHFKNNKNETWRFSL